MTSMLQGSRSLLAGLLLATALVAIAADAQMLAPGFVIRDLPVQLTSLNNAEYAPDDRLFAAGYDGRFNLLRNILDAVGYHVTLQREEPVTGTRVGEDEHTLSIAQAGGKVARLKKSDIVKIEPMTISLMPEGMDGALSPAELRDLMTYLLTESAGATLKK